MAGMKLSALIDLLQDYQMENGDDVEVRLMVGRDKPKEHQIAGITSTEEMDAEVSEDDRFGGPNILYLVEGSRVGDGRKVAWETAIQ